MAVLLKKIIKEEVEKPEDKAESSQHEGKVLMVGEQLSLEVGDPVPVDGHQI